MEGWLEAILRRRGRDEAVARVTDFREESVVNKGDNYTSDLTRMVMNVVLGSGKKTKKSIIVKTLPKTEAKAKGMSELGIFNKETAIYTNVLPLMKDLMEEMVDRDEQPWGHCIDFHPYDVLVFEDLKEKGYIMADRRKGLDLTHSSLVVASLAKFHSMSVVLMEKGLLDPDHFRESVHSKTTSGFDFSSYYDKTITNLATAIETTWEPEWHTYIEKIQSLKGKVYTLMKDIVQRNENNFNVLNHGDCWTNNMLFKYSSGVEPRLLGMKFVDFQMCYVNTYAIDLQYFLGTSLNKEVSEGSFDYLLQVYHDNLHYYLKYFGSSTKKAPNIEEIKAELKRLAPYCFAIAVSILTFMKIDPDNVPDLEKIMKEMKDKQEFEMDIELHISKPYTESAKIMLKRCKEYDFL